jgi:hypothetical protein
MMARSWQRGLMKFSILPSGLPDPDLLDADGHMKLLSVAELDAINPDVLRFWCHQRGRYALPTQELIAWLKPYIAGRNVIEIGAGNGDLAHYLGIRATDSWIMTQPDVARYYRVMRQPVIDYPARVEKIEASAAIEKYKPEIVIASWVTCWVDNNLPIPPGGGSMYGVKESEIIASGVTYLFIGNLSPHQHKPIRDLEHSELHLPFLRSRGDRDLDRLMIWNAPKQWVIP